MRHREKGNFLYAPNLTIQVKEYIFSALHAFYFFVEPDKATAVWFFNAQVNSFKSININLNLLIFFL